MYHLSLSIRPAHGAYHVPSLSVPAGVCRSGEKDLGLRWANEYCVCKIDIYFDLNCIDIKKLPT